MKDDVVMGAMCRDGVLAKIKKVPYYGEGKGFVFSGTSNKERGKVVFI